MSTGKLELRVLLAAIDRVTQPLKAITRGSGETAKALKTAKEQLKGLTDAQKRVDVWRKTDKDLAIVRNGLKGAQDRIKHLKDEIAKVPAPTRDMSRALKEAQEEARTLKSRVSTLAEKKERLRRELSAVGANTRNLAAYQRDLKPKLDAATAAVAHQTEAMKRQNTVARRMHAARAAYDKAMASRRNLMSAGAGVLAGGAAIGLPVLKAVKDYATFEDAMLGVARQVEGAREDNGQLTATYYEIGRAIKDMAERVPMATTEIARIVEAGARMGIQGKENLLVYAETAAVISHAFDLPVDEVGENMARIASLFHLPINRISELGDAINWLDDSSNAKGGDIIDVMQRIAGAADMVKMSYKDAAAMGSTFLHLGARADVAATASNALIGQLANAPMLATAKRYREGLKMLKLSARDLQLGMNKDATGTILKVLEAIKTLPQEKQLEATTRLFGKEYGDDVSKLAQNLSEYRRQLQLVNEERARGSMQREADARKITLNSRLLMAQNALFNFAADLGEKLKPTLVTVLEKTLAIVQAVRDWARENPDLADTIIKVVMWLSICVGAIGGLLLAAGAALAPLALLKLGLAGIGLTAGGAAAALGLFALKALLLAGVFYAAWKAGEWLYEKMGEWVSRIAGYKTTLGGFIFDVIELFKNGDWAAIGGFIVRGIEAGIDMLTFGLYSKVKGLMLGLIKNSKEALGIHSPSRVFAEIGGYTMAGLEQGLLGSSQGPLGAVRDMARRMAAAGAGMMIGGAAMAADLPRIDTRAPLSMAATTLGGSAPMIVNITIQAAPGMDETVLARQVAAELQRIEANRAARNRSRLRDAQ